ncbi:MAG: hypothetical protein IT428_19420 [Planctomycetaceae bacterium]|nr:hypothetical protein [Planctomycetaceae bacterium]
MNCLRHSWSLAVLGLALAAGASGCGNFGPELVKVTGKVEANGLPLSKVMVEFQPQDKGSPSIGYTDENGRYELRFSRDRYGALVGRHTVRIDFDYDNGSGDPKPPFKIPAQYNRQSELNVEVSPKARQHDFDLKIADRTVSQAR